AASPDTGSLPAVTTSPLRLGAVPDPPHSQGAELPGVCGRGPSSVQGTLTPRVPWREAGPVLHTLSRKSSNKGSCVGKNGLPLPFAHTPGKDT
ncbi:unnamed protein product, partial [Gulo gulo]